MKAREELSRARKLFEDGRYEESLKLLSELLEKKSLARGQKTKREAVELAAASADQLGRHDLAVSLRKKLLCLKEKNGSLDWNERICLARSLAALGKYEEAEEVLGEGPKQAEDPATWSLHRAMKGAIYLRKTQDYEGASSQLKEALSKLPEGASARIRGKVGVFLGHALMLSGRLSEARKVLKDTQEVLSRVLREDGGAVVEFARAEFFLGDTYRLAGQLNLAVECYDKAKRILGRSASAHFIKRYWSRKGSIYFVLHDYERALECYLHPEAISAIERIGNSRDYVVAYLGASKCLIASGRLEEGEEYLQKAKEFAGKNLTPLLEGHLALTKGALLEAKGRPDSAEHAYREAESAFRKVGKSGHVPGIVDALVSQGLLALSRGEVSKAVKLASQCSKEAARCGHLAVHAQELLLKSALLADGDVEAENLFKEILAKAELIPTPTFLFKIIANLYHYARRFKDYDLDVALETKLRKLKEAMDPRVYKHLLATYVDKRFVQLVLEHLTRSESAAS